MTNYISQPIEPFHVMARTVGPDANPPSSPASSAGGSSWNFLRGEVPGGKEAVAGLAFATAFLLLRGNPAFLSLAVLILYVTVISGLDAARRRIVQVPLGLATLMLIGHCLGSNLTYALTAGRAPVIEATWLPLFLAACVFYMPKLGVCRNILLGMSVLLLTGGVLPSTGPEAMFIFVQYSLFLALLIGLGVDLLNPRVLVKEAA